MSKIINLLEQLRNDNEALALLAMAGFKASDWPTLLKIGSPKSLLQNDLIALAIDKSCGQYKDLPEIIKNFRAHFDQFYQHDGFLLSPLEEEYENIFKISNAPLIFFGRFAADVLKKKPSVAIVGSRKADRNGQEIARKLAFSLGENSVNIVSGGALGIDSAAHRGALDSGGTTVVVSGLVCSWSKDEFYEKVSEKYRGRCAIIYPFAPWYPQGRWMFVNRNSFVVGLSEALVVVQGHNGSGTLHSAQFARSQKVPIFAVPGSIDNPLSAAPNKLIASGEAKALVDLHMDFFATKPKKKPIEKKVSELPELLKIIKENGGALSMPEILAKVGRPFLEIQRELLSYELGGQLIKRGPQFVLAAN